MMFRGTLIALLFNIGVVAAANETGRLLGEECDDSNPCKPQFDCMRAPIKKRCTAATCAKEAMQAAIDAGFDPESYIKEITSEVGLRRGTGTFLADETDMAAFNAAMEANPPRMQVFNQHLAECLNPNPDDKQTDTRNFFGLQWSIGAGGSYAGKYAVYDTPDSATDLALLSNCVGVLLGGDVGLDFLAQIISGITTDNFQKFPTFNTQMIPVFTAGPLGLAVGFEENQAGAALVTDVTVGASFGLSLGGFHQCFGEFSLV